MSHLTTSWAARDGTGPRVIAESHMAAPGQIVYFRKPAVWIINLGWREAGIFLTGDGTITADVPIAESPLTRATADAIAKTVLTKSYLKSVGGLQLERLCECQYGICGHCKAGDHDKCTTRVGFKGHPNPGPLAHVVSTSGAALTAVWPADGPSCRWYCPCQLCTAAAAEKPVEPRFLAATLF